MTVLSDSEASINILKNVLGGYFPFNLTPSAPWTPPVVLRLETPVDEEHDGGHEAGGGPGDADVEGPVQSTAPSARQHRIEDALLIRESSVEAEGQTDENRSGEGNGAYGRWKAGGTLAASAAVVDTLQQQRKEEKSQSEAEDDLGCFEPGWKVVYGSVGVTPGARW